MKKGKLVIIDYVTIITAFITFLGSLIIYNAFSHHQEAGFYILLMIANVIMIIIGFKNLKADYLKETI